MPFQTIIVKHREKMLQLSNLQVSQETPKILESYFIAFQYSDLCGSLNDHQRGQQFEEYLNLQALIKQLLENSTE